MMRYRGLYHPKGELIAYLDGLVLYSLDNEPSSRIENDFIVGTDGSKIWRIYNDGVYSLDPIEAIGYLNDGHLRIDKPRSLISPLIFFYKNRL